MNTETRFQRRPMIRLLAFICTLAMLLSVAAVLPITVGAKTTTYSIKSQDDFEKAINKAKSNKSDHAYFRFDSDVNIVLDENLPTSYDSKLYLFLLDKMNVTFDLNGKTITFKMTPRCNYASNKKQLKTVLPFFYIADTELTIKDSSAVNGQTGMGIMNFEAEEKGDHPYVPFLVYVAEIGAQAKYITLESGTLDGSGCNYSQSCFYLDAHSLVMNGGVIQNFHGKEGGAINNQKASLSSGAVTINGGTIKNCTATVNGGAIYNAGKLFLNGGTIVGCEATGDNTDTSRGRGGALYCATGSETTLSGTTISTNKAVNGGGIFMWGGTLDMTGGDLTFNTATDRGSELCMFHTDKDADVVFNMTGGSITSSQNSPSAIYAGSDKDKVNISGTATVNAWGKDYAIVNGSASNVSISASAQVKARSTNGKAFMYAPTVNGNATVWTRSNPGDLNFSSYTRILSPTEADYQRHYIWITYAGTSTVTFNDDGTPIYTATQPVGTVIQIPNNILNPSKDGFTFNEWNSYPDKGSLSDGYYTFQSTDEYFTADWAPLDTYVIKFVKGGDAPAGDIQSLKRKMEESFTLPTHPTLAGYTFEGWYVGDTKLGNDGQSITMAHLYLLDLISGNTVTVTARYKAQSYTLTIKPENGGRNTVKTLKCGDPLNLPTDLTKTGHTFNGWDGVPADGKMPANDLTVTAKWTTNGYTLTIKPENGEQDIVRTVAYGADLNLPTDLTKTGHAFNGWDGATADGKMPANDLTVTAKWTTNSYTLTIMLENGQADIVRTVKYGDPLNLPTDLAKTGNDFVGWAGAPADNKMPAHDLVVAAMWLVNFYTLTIKLDNGQADIVRTVGYGDDLNLPTDLTKTGHAFNGWDGATADGKMPANDLTVTAKWTTNGYTLTIKPENGEQDIVRTVAYGADLTLPTDLTKTGHTFNGWDGATADGKMPANNLTVTAKWTTNSYKLILVNGNGEEDTVLTRPYGKTIMFVIGINTPKRTGYKFTGWDGVPADGAMPAHDVTLTATWRKIGFESVTIDPTADLTLHLTALLPENYANATLRVTLDGKMVELQPTADATVDVYNFTYTGVTPYTLSYSLTLELVLNDQVIDSRTTSAAEICVEVAKAQPELKQTVADLMAFCAATADYLGYDTTTAPAIRDLMDANGLIASDREVGTSDTKYISARPVGDTRLLGVGLYFENTTGMYVRIKTSNVSRVTLTVGQTTYTAEDLTQKDWTEYVLYLPGVTLDNLTQINRVSLCVDGQEIQYMDYAITDYIAVTHKGTGTYSDGIRALTKALYNWKETAEQV